MAVYTNNKFIKKYNKPLGLYNSDKREERMQIIQK
jgi:hypothetical protein